MAGAPQVSSTVTTANAPAVTTPSFNTGMIAGYHTHYGDRQRTYGNLQALLADAFTTTEPLFRAATIYFSQATAPSQLVIGRRANAPAQVVNLVLTDTTSVDQYSLTVIGSDDISHLVQFTSTGTPATDATTLASYFAATGGPVTHVGTGIPAVTFTGVALLNETILIVVRLGGAVGTATFDWYLNGTLQATAVVTAATVALATTGLTANFAAGTYVAADTYSVVAAINCGVVTHATATVTFTQSSGKLNDFVQWQSGAVQNIQLTDATTDPGIAADLAAILAQNNLSFYGVSLDSNSKAEVLAAMAWCQAQGTGYTGKFGFFNNSDAANVNEAGVSTADLFSTAQLSGYHKVFAEYSASELLCYAGVSAMSFALGQYAGSYTLANKSQPGVLADTDASLTLTQALVLNTMQAGSPGPGGKSGNYYTLLNGQLNLWPGCTPAGDWADFIIWQDVVITQIQAAVQAAKSSGLKLPYDNNGLQAIYSAIYNVLVAHSNRNTYNAVIPATIVVTVPSLAAISQASINNRDLPGVAWQAMYTGAIQTVEAKGVVTL